MTAARGLTGISYPGRPIKTTTTINVPPSDVVSVTSDAIAAAQNVATLAKVSGLQTYLLAAIFSSAVPAAAVAGKATITGLQGGTIAFQFCETTSAGGFVILELAEALPATADNVDVVATIPAIASGAATTITLIGFQLPVS